MTGNDGDSPVPTVLDAIRAEWGAVLGRDVGPREDFFAVGGDSLQAIDVADRIRQRLGVPLEFIDLFDHPTPDALAARVEQLREQADR